MIQFIVIYFLISSFTNVSEGLFTDNLHQDTIRRDQTSLFKKIVLYSYGGFSCVQLFIDTDEFLIDYYKVFHSIEVPVIINETDKYCNGFFIHTQNAKRLRDILFTLRKYYYDRIVCYVNGRFPGAINKIKDEPYLFGYSEALLTNGSHSYKLHPIERKFYPLSIDDKERWGKYKEVFKFSGRRISIATFNVSLYTSMSPLDNEGNPGLNKQFLEHYEAWVNGLDFNTFVMLARLMNVSWRVKVPSTPENMWGSMLPNGRFSGGIFQAVQDKEVDMAMGCVWQTIDKYRLFFISSAKNKMHNRYLVRRPRPYRASWTSLFRPFSKSVWTLLFLTTLTNSMVNTILTYLRNKAFAYKRRESIWTSCYVSVGVLLQTNIPSSDERQGALRHLLNSWVITSLLLATFFSSSLVSHLTTPNLSYRPETIKELVEGGYFWGTTYKPYFEGFLDYTNPWHIKWAERHVYLNSSEEHIRLLDNDKYIIWGKSLDDSIFTVNEDYLPKEKFSEWQISNEMVSSYYTVYALSPGSQLLPGVNKYISMITETGHMKQIIKNIEVEPYMREVTIKTKADGVSAVPLSLSNFQGIFYILFIGLSIATISLSVEIIIHKTKTRRTYNSTRNNNKKITMYVSQRYYP